MFLSTSITTYDRTTTIRITIVLVIAELRGNVLKTSLPVSPKVCTEVTSMRHSGIYTMLHTPVNLSLVHFSEKPFPQLELRYMEFPNFAMCDDGQLPSALFLEDLILG
jgi:hypothetical protein